MIEAISQHIGREGARQIDLQCANANSTTHKNVAEQEGEESCRGRNVLPECFRRSDLAANSIAPTPSLPPFCPIRFPTILLASEAEINRQRRQDY